MIAQIGDNFIFELLTSKADSKADVSKMHEKTQQMRFFTEFS